MKICSQCQAENPDVSEICEACGAQLEETAAEETAEESAVCEEIEVTDEVSAEDAAEEAPAEPVKKSRGGLLAIITAVVVILIALVVVLVQKGKQPEAPVEEAPGVEAPAEEAPAETPAEESVPDPYSNGHHINAHGLPSHSIHYSDNGDGTFTYFYLNEAGETVSVTQEEVDALMAQEVASCSGLTLTNDQFLFYYDDQIYNFTTNYSAYLSFMMDTQQAMDEQLSMDGVNTWEQTFVDSSLRMFQQAAAVKAHAESEGFTMTAEEQAMVDSMPTTLDETAVAYGFADASAFLRAYFGPGATMENYLSFFAINSYVNAYLNQVQSQIVNTKDELSAYYDENAGMMMNNYGIEKIDQNVINVRHILITPESTTAEDGTSTISDEAWAAAEADAQKLYEEWKNGDATEDSFAELAGTHTQDPGSQTTGGLYEDVYPGQMVAEFNDWCFAEGRQVGDTGIVKTSYGYHIMFFSGEGDYTYWEYAVGDMLTTQKMSDFLGNIRGSQPLTSDIDKVVLLNQIAPTAPAAEESAEEATEQTDAQ